MLDLLVCICRLGETATFCWRLERVGSVGGVSEVPSLVAYEAVADSDAWVPGAPRVSYVLLSNQVCVPLSTLCEPFLETMF